MPKTRNQLTLTTQIPSFHETQDAAAVIYVISKPTRGQPLSTYATFFEKLTFLTPWYSHVRVRIRGLEMLVFRKILRTYLVDDPIPWCMQRTLPATTSWIISSLSQNKIKQKATHCTWKTQRMKNLKHQAWIIRVLKATNF